MSVEAMAVVLHHSQSSGTAKIVLLGIANHDGDGGAWPAIDTLAKYARVDRRNVQRALERLVALGEIKIVRNGGGDHRMADSHRPNLYHVTLRCPADCDRTTQHRTRGRVIDLFSEPLQTGAAAAPPGDVSDTLGVAVAPPKPSLNPTINSKKTTTSTRACKEGHPEASDTPGYCKYGDTIRTLQAVT